MDAPHVHLTCGSEVVAGCGLCGVECRGLLHVRHDH